MIDSRELRSLLGNRDEHLRFLRKSLGVSISARDQQIQITGDQEAVAKATAVFERLKSLAEKSDYVSPEEVNRALTAIGGTTLPVAPSKIEVLNASRTVRPRTPGQSRFVEAIACHDVVFCVGPAGTGKTYLSVAMAVAALKQQVMRKIVLVRPAVEAGESLGFLPGDLQTKINPYLRPLLDALQEMIDYDQLKRYLEQGVVEVIPLAYMRGRTLNEAFIILDEAQNTTVAQMKMFLTRLGEGSKIVASGDATQVDLPGHLRSGLIDAVSRLENISGFAGIRLHREDIVRHSLVQKILRAYDEGPQ